MSTGTTRLACGSTMTYNQVPEVTLKQFTDVTNPHQNDIICGRGGKSNNHVGNTKWRKLVQENKELYISLPKREKMMVALQIVKKIRSLIPPGRFLQKNDETGKWDEIGDIRARDKTSQALREGAPQIRENMIANSDLTQRVKFEVDHWYRTCLKHSIAKAHDQIQQVIQGGNISSALESEKAQSKLPFPSDMSLEARRVCLLAGIMPESPLPVISSKMIHFLIDHGRWINSWKEECDHFIDQMRIFYESSYEFCPESGLFSNSNQATTPVPPTIPREMPKDVKNFCIEFGIMPYPIHGLPSLAESIRKFGNNIRIHRSVPFETTPPIPMSFIEQSQKIAFPLTTAVQKINAMPQMPLAEMNATRQQNLSRNMMHQQQFTDERSLANQSQALFGGDASAGIQNLDSRLLINQVPKILTKSHGIDRAPSLNKSIVSNGKKRATTGSNYGTEDKKAKLFKEATFDTALNIHKNSERFKVDLDLPQTTLHFRHNPSQQQSDLLESSPVASTVNPIRKQYIREEYATDDSEGAIPDDMNGSSTQYRYATNRLSSQETENVMKKATESALVVKKYCSIAQINDKNDTQTHPDIVRSSEE